MYQGITELGDSMLVWEHVFKQNFFYGSLYSRAHTIMYHDSTMNINVCDVYIFMLLLHKHKNIMSFHFVVINAN
jgi:hypothetical protein